MRVCLYLEFSGFDLVAKSGFWTAFQNQKQALEAAGVEVVADPDNDYDILHLHSFGPRSFSYLLRAKRSGKRVVVHAHSIGSYDLRDSFTLTNLIAPLYERYLYYFYRWADCIFTPSARAKELLLSHGLESPIEVVGNGDLFFFPSYGENQPLALLEAAACGLPLVVRDLPEYRDWLEDGVHCLKGQKLDEFVELIKGVAEDERLRERLSQEVRKTAEEHSLEGVGERLLGLYSSLLNGEFG